MCSPYCPPTSFTSPAVPQTLPARAPASIDNVQSSVSTEFWGVFYDAHEMWNLEVLSIPITVSASVSTLPVRVILIDIVCQYPPPKNPTCFEMVKKHKFMSTRTFFFSTARTKPGKTGITNGNDGWIVLLYRGFLRLQIFCWVRLAWHFLHRTQHSIISMNPSLTRRVESFCLSRPIGVESRRPVERVEGMPDGCKAGYSREGVAAPL